MFLKRRKPVDPAKDASSGILSVEELSTLIETAADKLEDAVDASIPTYGDCVVLDTLIPVQIETKKTSRTDKGGGGGGELITSTPRRNMGLLESLKNKTFRRKEKELVFGDGWVLGYWWWNCCGCGVIL